MTQAENGRSPTFRWLVAILLPILLTLIGVVYGLTSAATGENAVEIKATKAVVTLHGERLSTVETRVAADEARAMDDRESTRSWMRAIDSKLDRVIERLPPK